MLLICTPIFMPVIVKLGIDPVHFGMIMILNLGIGLITPPVGPTLFVGCAIGKVTMEQVIEGAVAVLRRDVPRAAAGHLHSGHLAVAAGTAAEVVRTRKETAMRVFRFMSGLLGIVLLLSAAMSHAATFVYVSNADSKDISVLLLDADKGDLELVQTLPVGGQVMPMAVSPDRASSTPRCAPQPYTRRELRDRRRATGG